jgi:AbrB family looped-hinge helix DNA binding protein
MTITTMTSKGQIVIPAKTRARLGLRKGARMLVEDRADEIVIRPLSANYFDAIAGSLKTKGRLTRCIVAEHAKQRKYE